MLIEAKVETIVKSKEFDGGNTVDSIEGCNVSTSDNQAQNITEKKSIFTHRAIVKRSFRLIPMKIPQVLVTLFDDDVLIIFTFFIISIFLVFEDIEIFEHT